MRARFSQFLKAPVFENPEKNVQSQNIHIILLSTIALTFVFLLYSIFFPPIAQVVVAIVVLFIEISLYIVLKRGHTQLVSILFSSMVWLAILAEVILYGGIRDTGYAAFAIVIVISSLTMGVKTGIGFAALTILAGTGLAIAENQSVLPPYAQVAISSVLVSYSITFIGISLLIYLAIQRITSAIQKAIQNELTQKEINLQLKESQTTLEIRTAALEQRNSVLQAVAEIARRSINPGDEQTYLNEITDFLSSQFAINHIGIYLLDEKEEIAYLRATNEKTDTNLKTEQHKLSVSKGDSPRGFSKEAGWMNFNAGGQPYRISPPIVFSNLDNNISMPLIAGAILIGLINIQSKASSLVVNEPEIIQTLADQVAISIQNIRLLAELQTRSREIKLMAGQMTQDTWRNIRGGQTIGYQFDHSQVSPTGEYFTAGVASKLRTGHSIQLTTHDEIPSARLLAPILVHGESIGVIGYEDSDPNHQWLTDEIALLETVATRVGLSLENNRLLEETSRRADRERTVSEITTKIRNTTDPQEMLSTALQELQRVLQVGDIRIRQYNPSILKPDTEEPNPPTSQVE